MRGTPDQAGALMKAYAGELEAWEVGAAVGNVKNNEPELMERANLLKLQAATSALVLVSYGVTTDFGF
jgi:hypothetical protein